MSWLTKHRKLSDYKVVVEIKNKRADIVDTTIEIEVEARTARQAKNWVRDNFITRVAGAHKIKK